MDIGDIIEIGERVIEVPALKPREPERRTEPERRERVRDPERVE